MSDTYTDTSVQGAERKLSDLAGQITGRANDSDMQQIKAKEKDLETKIADMPSAIDKAVSKDYPDRPAPPKPPKMEEFQAPQPRGAFDSFGNFATALGALGGLLTRHPLTASLNAATASMKALKENDVAAATQQWEQYKQQQAYAFKMADYEVARYGAYLNDKHAMTEEILSGMKMEASLLQNQNMRHATETGDLSIAAGLYDRMAQLNIQAQQAADKVDPIMKVLRSEVEAANKSGKPMTGDQIAGRLAELNRMADPKLQEVIRSHEAMEKIRGQVNQKKQQDAADNIEVARGQIAELEKMAADPDATVTGLGGRASRIGETVKGWVSSGPTPASDFQSKLETLQLTLPKLLTGASKSSADERARVDTIARGLSPGDTAEKTVNALKQLDAIMAERETRIKGGGEDFGGGLEGLSDEEIREQLNKAFGGEGASPFKGAVKQFPMLGNLGIAFVSSPGKSKEYLEFWPPGESGTAERPRPKGIPIDRPGIETFRPDVKPLDVMGDVASHWLVKTDPTMKDFYQRFEQSLTGDQKARLRDQYEYAQKEGDDRAFAEWYKSSGLPAYFRGYAFKQWPDADRLYTPEQRKMFDQMMDYLRGGQ